jgi:hypothetical protein
MVDAVAPDSVERLGLPDTIDCRLGQADSPGQARSGFTPCAFGGAQGAAVHRTVVWIE